MNLSAHVRYWLLLLPLIGLLGVTYWLNMQNQDELIKKQTRTPYSADALIENFSATKMNNLGSPHFIIKAKALHHFSDDDSTSLDEPMLTTLSKDGIAINTQAKQGRISSKGEDIFLSGQVEMSREANAMQSKLSLKTEFLHIRPSQNLIKTDQAVLLTDANTSVKAVGLEMDYKMRTFKLLSHVRSQYVPVK